MEQDGHAKDSLHVRPVSSQLILSRLILSRTWKDESDYCLNVGPYKYINLQGFSLFTMFFLYFCGFAGGSFLMQNYGYTFKDVLQVFIQIYRDNVLRNKLILVVRAASHCMVKLANPI